MPNIKNVFDFIKCINQTKEPASSFTEDDWTKFDSFMVHRGLSQDRNLIELCSYVQSLGISDKKQLYSVYRELVPFNKKWNKWVKSTTKGKNKDLINILSEYYECSSKRVIEYLDILEKDDILKILTSLGYEEKESKKLIK